MAIKSTVEAVCEGCFLKWNSLASVTFSAPSRLLRIEQCAFVQTGLASIAIPTSVKFIGDLLVIFARDPKLLVEDLPKSVI
jgi:hypothetical protein